MRNRTFAAAWLVAAGLVALARPAAAQQQQGSTATDTAKAVAPANPPMFPGFSAAFDLGGRGFLKDLTAQQKAGFEMYKTLSSGAVLNDLVLAYTPEDSLRSYTLTGHKIGELDQTVAFRGTQPGKFDINAKWDEIPHTFSTDARMLGSRPTPDYFSLAGTPRGDTTSLNSTLRGLQTYLGPVRTNWDALKFGVSATPSSTWDTKIEYTRTGKSGDRPLGMPFGGPSNNAREILEPIDQTVHDLRISQGFSQENYQLQVAYNLSRFENAYNSVVSDNPFTATDLATAGSSRGRMSLAPSNLAQTVVGTGGLNLPLRSRVYGSASLAQWKQDEAFIPSTINSAITSPLFTAIPASAGGKATITTLQGGFSSRPIVPVTLSGHVRYFRFQDQTAVDAIPVMVVNDRSLAAADTAERFPFSKHNADLGVRWHVFSPVSLSAGVAYESMTHDEAGSRNVGRLSEHTSRLSADYAALSWLSLRGMVSHSQRTNDGYTQLNTSENVNSRRFDEADRNRDRAQLIATVTPIDALDLSGSFEQGRDAYIHSPLGLQSDNSRAIGADLSYSPVSRFTVSGGATWENFDNVILQQYKSGTQTNNPTFEWQDNNTDRVTTTYGNFMAVLIPEKLDLGGTFEWSKATWHMYTFNPNGAPAAYPGLPAPTAAQLLAATAYDFKPVTQTLQPVSLFLRHQVRDDWSVTVRYQTELFSQNDFRTTMGPALGNFMYLGNNLLPYNAQFLTITLSYRPSAIKLGRSTL